MQINLSRWPRRWRLRWCTASPRRDPPAGNREFQEQDNAPQSENHFGDSERGCADRFDQFAQLASANHGAEGKPYQRRASKARTSGNDDFSADRRENPGKNFLGGGAG